MKKCSIAMIMGLCIILEGYSQDVTWPRQLTNQGSVLTMYQPQVQNWDQFKKLDFRLAFSLVPNQGKEVLGVLYMLASTDVNMDNHKVLISNLSVLKTNFPSLDAESAQKMGEIVKSFFPSERTIEGSVEQIVACTPKVEPATTVMVKNDPPVIFTSKRPTILIQLEGKPTKASTGKDNLEYVINANFPLFFDKTTGTYYLYDGLEWQKGIEPAGPWAFTGNLPKSLFSLASDTNWRNLKGTIPAVTQPDKNMPVVYCSEKLAELILFEGEPAYKMIAGTTLKFATNTNSDIFFCNGNKKFYYLSAGRWFSSPGLNGPWTYATPNLPIDFGKIPDESPASSIMAFVPGTEQAKDAVMIAQIPTTIEVDAAQAAKQVNITYSGEAKFDPIENTTLSYAVNTTDKVIRVSGDQYYACVSGIWFVALTPTGPWVTATTVPQVIYAMPSSSPVYNVTYVTQTVTSTNVVVANYTSGYMGVYVMGTPSGVIIISGTGFYYPPYYYYPPIGYPVYYPYPVTFGCYAYHAYPYGGVAYHASYNPNTGVYARSATAYSPYGKATAGQAYNSKTGTYARGASVSTPYGSRSAAQAYNPYTGASGSTRQGSTPNAQWGSSSVSNGKGQSTSGGHVTTSQGTTAAAKTKNGDMYATSNGNVYKNTGNGWEDASKSQPGNATGKSNDFSKPAGVQNNSTQEMNKAAQDRQRGNTQSQQFNGKSSANFGGGQSQGGGGGRRR